MIKQKLFIATMVILFPLTANVRAQSERDKMIEAEKKEGLLDIFKEAGANVTSSECGLCVRQSLSAGEVCVSSGNRNYRGRMGPKESSVFLSNAATVAASAVAGEIADPREFV